MLLILGLGMGLRRGIERGRRGCLIVRGHRGRCSFCGRRIELGGCVLLFGIFVRCSGWAIGEGVGVT